MSKHYSKKSRLKYVFLALACTASFSLTGLAAACSKTDTPTEDEKTTSKEDTQLLKNGNFEFFNVPEQKKGSPAPVYLISSPNNWSHGGTSSYTMSGIIGTSEKAWEKITDSGLEAALDYNNALSSGDSNYDALYVDYNGMKSSDILYKDTYAALNDKDDEADHEHDKDLIENPGTRYNVKEKNGKLYGVKDGKEFEVYEDENGDYFFDKDCKEPFSHVLMLHNYATTHNGIAQRYSSVSVDLPANTAAEISVWVKTAYLLFDKGTEVTQDRGANISVTQTVGSSTLDKFTISNINTQTLIKENKIADDNNGWIEYTVYVNACDFASSTVSIELGLGEESYNVEGYAFFDDISVKKFVSLDDEDCSYGEYENAIKNTTYQVDKNVQRKAYCTLSSDASEKVFKADSYKRNNGAVNYERFSSCFRYLVDLASENEHSKVVFGENLKAGLTVDDDNYVSAGSYTNNKFFSNYNGEKIGLTVDQHGGVKLPTDFTALNTGYDLLACVKAGHEFTSDNAVKSQYYKQLNEALASAAKLGDGEGNVLVTFSAYGAAYTTSFQLEIAGNGYQIISFWLKTSDMDGNTAATVRITENGNDDNSANVAVDSTGIVTDIDDDNKDIYNGWVQCFFFVKNEDENAKTLDVEFSFGNTAIKGTSDHSYKAGWAALANMQTLDVDDKTFGYTGSGDHTASLTIAEKQDKQTAVFDEVYGSQKHEIENGIVNPSSYTGVNGESSRVVNNGHVSIPYDNDNTNDFAGLINKEYFVKGNYNNDNNEWYQKLLNSFNITDISAAKALDNWNEVFGQKSVQPLVIVNKIRDSYVEIKDANETTYKNYLVKNDKGEFVDVADDAKFDEKETYYSRKAVRNYGFIGESKTVSANSYSTVSVRVKVSAGAIAYIYLVDTSEGKQVMKFTAPSYSFYYDTDGNVLKAKHDEKATLAQQRANILYTLRDDGLYEDKDGNLYANTYNYTKLYTDESVTYYNSEKQPVSFDKLISGETYYDANGKELSHYLVTTGGTKIYEYKNGCYHYIVEGVTQSEDVLSFDTKYARYEYADLSEKYMTVIDGNQQGVAGKWITVNYVIHAGSEAKSYRLELWSGERDKTTTPGNNDGGSVLFDYSYTSISDTTLRDEYENEIILAYQQLLLDNGVTGFATSTENISYYEKLVKDNNLGEKVNGYEVLKNYTAHYYTYSLYDSADYQPYNATIASADSTGYDYSIEDYSESLAYFEVKDGDVYNVFADYSAIDQSVSLDSDTDHDHDEDEEKKDNSNVWLLVSSILLVVALFFAMIAILVKDMLKKTRRNKVISKNNYNHNKAGRRTKKNVADSETEEVSAEAEVEANNEVEEPAVETDETVTVESDNTGEAEEQSSDDTDNQ